MGRIKWPLTVVAITLFLAVQPANVKAELVVLESMSNSTSFAVLWDWNPEVLSRSQPFGEAPLGGMPWFVDLQLNLLPGNRVSIDLTVQHRANPHAGETFPAPSTATFMAGPGPFVVVFTVLIPHPNIGDFDRVTFVFLRGLFPAGNTIRAIGEHTTIPEPTTLLLLGMGLAGVAIKTRKELKTRKRGQGSH